MKAEFSILAHKQAAHKTSETHLTSVIQDLEAGCKNRELSKTPSDSELLETECRDRRWGSLSKSNFQSSLMLTTGHFDKHLDRTRSLQRITKQLPWMDFAPSRSQQVTPVYCRDQAPCRAPHSPHVHTHRSNDALRTFCIRSSAYIRVSR
jgi:hypothetical protein